jgi:hypothetical protein
LRLVRRVEPSVCAGIDEWKRLLRVLRAMRSGSSQPDVTLAQFGAALAANGFDEGPHLVAHIYLCIHLLVGVLL